MSARPAMPVSSAWRRTAKALPQLLSLLRCSICQNTVNDPWSTPCNHTFCRECILYKLKDRSDCPFCRNPVWPKDLQKDNQRAEIVLACESLAGLVALSASGLAPDAASDATDDLCLSQESAVSGVCALAAGTTTTAAEDAPHSLARVLSDTPSLSGSSDGGQPGPAARQGSSLSKPPLTLPRRGSRGRTAPQPVTPLIAIAEEAGTGAASPQRGTARRSTPRKRATPRKRRDKPPPPAPATATDDSDFEDPTHKRKRRRKASPRAALANIGQTPPAVAGFREATRQSPRKRTPSSRLVASFEQAATGPGTATATRLPRSARKNAKGETPLHRASIQGNAERVAAVLAAFPQLLNDKDYAGWTALHEACNHGHLEVARTLLAAGADINMPGFGNDTPLHDAVRSSRLPVVNLLLEAGADMNARNELGQVALDLVEHPEVKRVLLEADTRKASLSRRCKPELSQDPPPAGAAVAAAVPAGPDASQSAFSILTTGLSGPQKAETEGIVNDLGARLAAVFDEDVTHVVVASNPARQCPRTIKYLNALIRGKWIVDYKWLKKCQAKGEWLSEKPFELAGDKHAAGAPRKARINASKQRPRLFSGCQFYFHGDFPDKGPTRDDLISLAKAGGATVLGREPRAHGYDEDSVMVPYHAHPKQTSRCFVVYPDMDQPRLAGLSGKAVECSMAWFLDCFSQFAILPTP